MKGISLNQPFASLVVGGLVKSQVMGWGTNYRGGLVIRARLRWNRHLIGAAGTEPLRSRLASLGYGVGPDDDRPPLRCLLGTVELAACYRSVAGQPGSWVWVFRFPRPFKKPIPHPGGRGLYEVPNELFSTVFKGTVSVEPLPWTEN